MQKQVVVLAGHSNRDPGAVANGVKEAEIAVSLRGIIASKLTALGYEVITDGKGKDNWELRDAVKLIKPGVTAIELHCNAASNSAATGVEVIAPASMKAKAQKMAQAIANVTKDRVRGDKGWRDQKDTPRGSLAIVNAGGMIVELFFISNKNSLIAYKSVEWLVASAIVDCLVEE